MTIERPTITESRNPLGYFIYPNQADAHYVAARDMKSFIAYGMLSSFLDPDDIHPRFEVRDEDIRDLRRGFLACLERTADMLPSVGRGEDVDFGSHGTGCTLYPVGHNPEREATAFLDLSWRFDMRAIDGAVCLVLECMDENGSAGDPFPIWVDSRCFNNRARVHRLITEAKASIGMQ